MVGPGQAGKVGRGSVRHGMAGRAWPGSVRRGRRGTAWHGKAWRSMAGRAWQGWARLGRDKLGIARLSRYTFRATSSKAEQGTHNSLVLGSNPRWPI